MYNAQIARRVVKAAQRVIVVSMQKAGTHLIQRVMHAMGYMIYGSAVRVEPGMEPQFGTRERLRIAKQVLDPDQYEALKRHGNDGAFKRETDGAWEKLGWCWQKRLGAPISKRYGFAHDEWINQILIGTSAKRSLFSQTPAGVCWILHELDAASLDGNFLNEWVGVGEPKIILNYRDPRDVMLSFVNYLSGMTGRGFGSFHEYKIFGRILSQIDSFDDKLSYALRDVAFPGHGDLERAYWMYRHPDICKVSFEELAGPRGGGTSQGQRLAVKRILRHVAIPTTEELVTNIAASAFDPNAFTFFRGQIGAWRKMYTKEHTRIFDAQFGNIANLFGYK